MEKNPTVEDRLSALEGQILGLQIGLQNLVCAICSNQSIDIKKIADAYNKLNSATIEVYGLADQHSGQVMTNIGVLLHASAEVKRSGVNLVSDGGQAGTS